MDGTGIGCSDDQAARGGWSGGEDGRTPDCWLERIAKQEEREYIGKRIK